MSDNSEKKKIFISYAREDAETARRLYYDLKEAGVVSWMDKEKLLIGQNWEFEIRQAIKDSSYFLALLSSNSVSKQGYVQKELKMALDILAGLPKSKIFLLPVRLDECFPLDEALQEINRGDLFPDYDKGLHNILQAIDIPAKSKMELAETHHEKNPEDKKLTVFATPKDDESVAIEDVSDKVNELVFVSLEVIRVTLKKKRELLSSIMELLIKVILFLFYICMVALLTITVLLSWGENDIKVMLKKFNFYDSVLNESGDFKNNFIDNKDSTVTDRATGLMWQKSGSENRMKYYNVQSYIDDLNHQKFASYDDWRLPTIKELASLLENRDVDGLYLHIDPVFDRKQTNCWADKSLIKARLVTFKFGRVNYDVVIGNNSLLKGSYVRAVRSRTIDYYRFPDK